MFSRGLISIACIASCCAGLVAAEVPPVNHGEDITQPVDRFDVRVQYETLPDVTWDGKTYDDISQDTLTLRSDLVFFSTPNQLALRFDVPLVRNNKPDKDNRDGSTESGLGDVLMQAIYVRSFDARWAGGIGMRTILPTATAEGLGTGKWQLVPTVAVRANLPEISRGSYAGLAVREFVSVAGSSKRSDIRKLQFEPQLNIVLPDRWLLNFSPECAYNLETDAWFVPLDIMVGKKFGTSWVASLEYQYGLVTEDDSYNQWVEARIGYFF